MERRNQNALSANARQILADLRERSQAQATREAQLSEPVKRIIATYREQARNNQILINEMSNLSLAERIARIPVNISNPDLPNFDCLICKQFKGNESDAMMRYMHKGLGRIERCPRNLALVEKKMKKSS